MRKFTSFLMSVLVGCSGAFAQEEFTDKMVRIGTAQETMQPNTWYFLHTPRTQDRQAFATPGQPLQSNGSIPMDMGLGKQMMMTKTADVEALKSDQGALASDYLCAIMRFVPVEGTDTVFYIQCATGNYMSTNPNTGTVNEVQHKAGLSGKYNFYKIKVNGTPNTAGRFGWNKEGLTNRMDSNGPNGTLTYYASGERKATETEANNDASGAAIVGNDVWQIYTVEIAGDADYYMMEVDALTNDYIAIEEKEDGNFVPNLQAGINVGNSYGNYRQEDVDAFLKLYEVLTPLIELINQEDFEALKELYPTEVELKKVHDDFMAAYNAVINNKISMTVDDIKPGYYTVNSANYWYANVKDTVYYTQEEANEFNTQNNLKPGDEGYLTTDSIKNVQTVEAEQAVKGLYAGDDNGQPTLAWGPEQQNVNFLWKIETVEGKPSKYRLVSMANKMTFHGVATSTNVKMVANDTATVQFDFLGKIKVPSTEDAFHAQNDSTISYAIRNSHQAAENYYYLHCGNHGGGSGKGSWVVGWDKNGSASKWYLTPVSDEEAAEWMNSDEVKLAAMMEKADSIVAVVPSQIRNAMDLVVSEVMENDSVVTDPSQFFGSHTIKDGTNTDPQNALPELEDKEDSYKYLIDGDTRSYWHSNWASGAVPAHTHYLQISSDEPLDGEYVVKLTRRNVTSGNHITRMAVRGYAEKNNNLTFDQGEDLGTLVLPYNQAGETVVSEQTFSGKNFPVVRFYWEESAPADKQNGYWHASEFNVFKAECASRYEVSQYQARKKEIDALTAALDTWKKGGYRADSLELMQNEEFKAAYNALVAAAQAWGAVYVDPAELRQTVAQAPAEDMFVRGNNPGEWAEGVVTPQAVVSAAQAYDESGLYTPAESQKHIDAINNAVADVFSKVNKVQTTKWYRLKFHTEETYEQYGWETVGADAAFHEQAAVETSPALFGKVIASGISVQSFAPFTNNQNNPDTVTVYNVETSDEVFEDNRLLFYSQDDFTFENGEDQFRFIQATDSSYMIQHRASGLFVKGGRPVVLSSVPTYFKFEAMGTGACLLSYTDVLGKTLSNHKYLHGQRADNVLTCWEAKTLGSNSMMLIEEVEDIAEVPATTFQRKLWPGMVYTFVSPVDVTVGAEAGAKAYGAQLEKTDEGYKVLLKSIESETISAGTPYVMITDVDGDYVTEDESLQAIADRICAEKGQYGREEKYAAQLELNDMYTPVTMSHGMQVDTIQRGLGDLVGTFSQITVPAGEAVVAHENGFKHTVSASTIYAYSAYIQSNVDATSEDILSDIIVETTGNVETGIQDALDNVAKSGNIYTVDGKLVGKGNVNTISRMPAGIYIINGVKVVKK